MYGCIGKTQFPISKMCIKFSAHHLLLHNSFVFNDRTAKVRKSILIFRAKYFFLKNK